MGLQGNQTKEWFERASAALVNGVSSQFRYWGDDDTIVIDRGEAGHLIDMDGTGSSDLARSSSDTATKPSAPPLRRRRAPGPASP